MFYGIIGSSPDGGYGGPWYVEVDCWNEYPKLQAGIGMAPAVSSWYPPVEGLLQGDSFHIIPGNRAGIFGFTGTSLQLNGLGLYAQGGVWVLPNAMLGAGVSGEFALGARGYNNGVADWFTYSSEQIQNQSITDPNFSCVWVQRCAHTRLRE